MLGAIMRSSVRTDDFTLWLFFIIEDQTENSTIIVLLRNVVFIYIFLLYGLYMLCVCYPMRLH